MTIPEKLTLRTANRIGDFMAEQLKEELYQQNIAPEQWPTEFPISLETILSLPETNSNVVVAEKVHHSAKKSWADWREMALMADDLKLEDAIDDDEEYEEYSADFDSKEYKTLNAWNLLCVCIEESSGELELNWLETEEQAQSYVEGLLADENLSRIKGLFGEEYEDFIKETRESIRQSALKASEKMRLLSLFNENNQNLK